MSSNYIFSDLIHYVLSSDQLPIRLINCCWCIKTSFFTQSPYGLRNWSLIQLHSNYPVATHMTLAFQFPSKHPCLLSWCTLHLFYGYRFETLDFAGAVIAKIKAAPWKKFANIYKHIWQILVQSLFAVLLLFYVPRQNLPQELAYVSENNTKKG